VESREEHPIKNTNLQTDKSASLLLWLCLSADFAFIVLHIIYKTTTLLGSPFFSVKRDLGYSEFFQYMKFLWIIILLVYIIKTTGSWSYLSWVAVFLYFLVDDAFQVHEKIGQTLADKYDFIPPFNLRLQDLGELAVYAIAGVLLMLGLIWAYTRGSRNFKGISIDILLLVSILVFFGVVVDMAEITSSLGIFVKETLGLIDDGGEMIVTSFMLWYVFRLTIRNEEIDDFLYLRLRTFLRRNPNALSGKSKL
jgi:hypothetical protein